MIDSKRIHENAIKKGFWPKDANIGEKFMLIISELSEAIEHHRNGMPFDPLDEGVFEGGDISEFVKWYENKVKGKCIAEELADTIIRLCDMFAYVTESVHSLSITRAPTEVVNALNFGERCFEAVGRICQLYQKVLTYKANKPTFDSQEQRKEIQDLTEEFSITINTIKDIAVYFDVSIYSHIKLKIRYNEHREHLHGKLY